MSHSLRAVSLPRRFLLLLGLAALVLAVSTRPAAGESPGLLDRSALNVYDDSLTVTTDNAVVENLEIRGTLRIEADNVVVRNVWVYTSSFWTIYVDGGSATFEHVEIGNAAAVGQRGIGGNNVTGRWLDIHHVEDGIKLGSGSLYEYVRVHDLASTSPDPHADAVQADGGVSGATIRFSTLDSTGSVGFGNAAAQIESSLGPVSDVTIEDSWLDGGAYTVFVRDGGSGFPSGVHIRNNTFGPTRAFGILSSDGSFDFSGNTLSDGRRLDGLGNALAGFFADDDGSPHEADIDKLAAAGITSGCAPGRYCPDSPLSRAEAAVLLLRSVGESPSDGRSFADVPASAWYAGAVERLFELGIANGCAPGRFCPGDPLSRAEMATLLVRAAGASPSPTAGTFLDVPGGAWYAGFVEELYNRGITAGCAASPLRFCPGNHVTRAEIATFLARHLGL